ncbi:MAG: hypothetical protein ACRDJE_21565 [Dehalococcoidia bacterium]
MVSGYLRGWKRHGATYKSMLDEAEEVLASVSRSYQRLEDEPLPVLQPVITREHSDVPDVTMRWRSDDAIQRSVQITVVHDTNPARGEQFLYQLSISAWHDDLNLNQRHWWQEQIGVPVGPEDIRESAHDAVEAARRLRMQSLRHTDPLLPLPPGLSEEQRDQLIKDVK